MPEPVVELLVMILLRPIVVPASVVEVPAAEPVAVVAAAVVPVADAPLAAVDVATLVSVEEGEALSTLVAVPTELPVVVPGSAEVEEIADATPDRASVAEERAFPTPVSVAVVVELSTCLLTTLGK